MKQVNKDYISVVRSNNGRLLFERIPMIKSDRVKDRLAEFLDDDRATIEDMLEYLQEQPIFKFFALPHYEAHGDIDFCRPEDWVLYELTKSLKEARTKVKFLEEVLKLIEECDYRWNVVRITNGFPDIIIRSHSGYESSYVRIRLNDEVSIVFESYELGGEFEGTLAYTVYKNDVTVRPYRSVVQLFDCSDDILHATKVFDPEEGQWDNALRSLVTTANVILTNPEEYFKRSVIEAGQLMLEKIKQMGLDLESYYTWLEGIQDAINVNYSECDKSMEQLDNVDDSNKRLYELYVMGQKMAQALILGENLCGWVNEGLEFIGMDKVHGDLTNLAGVLLKEMEQYHDELPKEVFEECYGEYDIVENEKHDIAVKLRSSCERLRMLLQMEQRFESEDAETSYNEL